MRELVLMRHGSALSAQESGGRGDSDRKLSPAGRAQIAVSARQLKNTGFSPGVIISSPFLRAVETADIAAELFPAAGRVQDPALVSGLQFSEILGSLTRSAAGAPSALVVGHQPIMGVLCSMLLRTAGPHFTTGSFAYLKFPEGFDSGKAELAEFFSPENI